MVDFNSALIKKIVRLLESNHDGERAAAAGKLHSMAKDKGKNVDEMLAAVYGGGTQRPDPRNEQPRRKQSSWGNEWGGGNFQDPPWDTNKDSFAEGVRRRCEAAKKAAEEAQRKARARADARQQKEYERNARGDSLDRLHAEWNRWGESMLTVWEQDFVSSIFDWKGALTGPQETTITRILEKYAAYAKRNGEAESFWKA